MKPVSFPLVLGLALSLSLPSLPAAFAESSPYQKDYQFSIDVFTKNIPVWKEQLAGYAGKPGVRYLEIGIHEGGSFLWVLDNILTGEGSEAVGMDTFQGPFEQVFYQNLTLSGQGGKTTVIKGRSQTEAKKLPPESFDIIYIDGSHLAPDVLADAVLAFDLLKPDGLLIFDDYTFHLEYPEELRPRASIDAFLLAYRNQIEKVYQNWQMIVRKKSFSGPCVKVPYCSPFGRYGYSWKNKKLYAPPPSVRPVETSEEERLLIEKFSLSRKPGEPRFELGPEWEENAAFQALMLRLGLTREELESLGRENAA